MRILLLVLLTTTCVLQLVLGIFFIVGYFKFAEQYAQRTVIGEEELGQVLEVVRTAQLDQQQRERIATLIESDQSAIIAMQDGMLEASQGLLPVGILLIAVPLLAFAVRFTRKSGSPEQSASDSPSP